MWVVLVNYNGLADTLRCLRSLEAAGRPDTVVVDNASAEDPSADAARAISPGAHVVRNPVNGGWAGGNNVGVRHALARGADFVILLNNDTVVAPDFVARLTAAAEAHPAYGVLGPVIRFMDPPHEVQTDGTRLQPENAARVLPSQAGAPHLPLPRGGGVVPLPWGERCRRRRTDHRRGHRQRLLHDDPRRGLPPHRPHRRAFLPDPRGVRLLPPRPPGRLPLRRPRRGPRLAQGVQLLQAQRRPLAALLRRPQPLPAALQARRDPPPRPRASFAPFGSISSTPTTATPWSARPGTPTPPTRWCRAFTTPWPGGSAPSAPGRGRPCPCCAASSRPGGGRGPPSGAFTRPGSPSGTSGTCDCCSLRKPSPGRVRAATTCIAST